MTTSGLRSRYTSSECSDHFLTPRTKSINVRTLYPQELSTQLRAVRRTVFILSWRKKPCYIEQLLAPHMKLLVAGNLNLALFNTMTDRTHVDDTSLERLVTTVLGIDHEYVENCLHLMKTADMHVTEVYDTIFRWMGDTKVLVETIYPTNKSDIKKLEQLHANFPDARYIWETSDPHKCTSEGELLDWYESNSTIHTFLTDKPLHAWRHVTEDSVISNPKDISEIVTECVGVFVSRHYDKMNRCLTTFLEKQSTTQPPTTPQYISITNQDIIRLSEEILGYQHISENGTITPETSKTCLENVSRSESYVSENGNPDREYSVS